MIRDGTQAWCGVKQKEWIAHAVLYWQELISFYKRISIIILKFDFQEVACPTTDTILSPKTNGWLLGYTTVSWSIT